LIPLGFGLLVLQTVGALAAPGLDRAAAPGAAACLSPQTYAILMLVAFFGC
jgi:hypothetical protein